MSKVILTGRISAIFAAEIFGSFEKRKFWLEETEGKYPQTWELEVHQGTCNLMDNYHKGQMVSCHVDVRGRFWEKGGKSGVMNTLKCWKIESPNQQHPASNTQPADITEPVDDLPF